MPASNGLWPIRFVHSSTPYFCGALVFCLLPLIALAQEPEVTAESSAATSEISSSSKSSEAPLYPSRDMRDKSLIAAAMDDEAQWLETEYGKILALYRPTEAKMTHGVLILFHAAENPQSWPPILENLRAYLPRYGWETLAISLPHEYPAVIPARPSSSSFSASASSADTEVTTETGDAETTPETASSSISGSSSSSTATSSAVARDLLVKAYADAAFAFLKEKGKFNTVLLTDNSSAYLVLQNLLPQIKANPRDETTVDGPLQALVITNLQQQEPINKQELEAIFGAEQLPILDIFFAPENNEQAEFRDLHKAVAMRKKTVNYQQLLMDLQSKPSMQDHQSYLLGRVRGFMQQKASGAEVKTPEDENRSKQTQ